MAINLLSMLQDQLGDNVIGQASKLIGENSSSTKSAISAILPTILGSVVSKGSNASGAGRLLNMIADGKHDGSMFNNLSGLLGGGSASDGLMNSGKTLVSSFLGNNQNSVLDLLGKTTGLKRNSTSGLMSMLAPMVMGMIGKQVKGNGLNASGLMDLLGGQKKHISSALPAGMGSILGFANTGGSTSNSGSQKTSTQPASSGGGGGGFLKWAVMGVAVLALLGYFGFKTGFGPVDDASSMVTDTAGDMVNTAGDAAGAAGDAVKSMAGGTLDAAGNLVDEAGNVVAKAGEFTKDAAGNVVDAAGNVMNKAGEGAMEAGKGAMEAGKDAVAGAAGAAGDAASSAAGAADAAAQFSLDDTGNLLDAKGNVAFKAGEFSTDDEGFYVDKKGNRIGNALKKVGEAIGNAGKATGKAIGNAAGATGDFFKSSFSKMFKKESGAETTYTLSDITFNPENHRITNFSKNEVEGLANALKADPNAKIQVQAFTDDGGNKMKNKALSKTRAKVVHDMLVALGVNNDQISAKGMGAKDGNNNKVQVVVE